MAESAYFEFLAAVIEAKVSGSEVPKATKVMAVTPCLRPTTQPNRLANSPTMAVTAPMKHSAIMKLSFPLNMWFGGMKAKRSFQPMAKKWNTASEVEMGSITLLSSIDGPRHTAALNLPNHVGSF